MKWSKVPRAIATNPELRAGVLELVGLVLWCVRGVLLAGAVVLAVVGAVIVFGGEHVFGGDAPELRQAGLLSLAGAGGAFLVNRAARKLHEHWLPVVRQERQERAKHDDHLTGEALASLAKLVLAGLFVLALWAIISALRWAWEHPLF